MRIGIMLGATAGPDATLAGLLEHAQKIESMGFPSLWLAQVFGFDAITSLALVGRETKRLELGTAVVPTYPRHPFAMAQQALTAGSASDGRFRLGIGLSHAIVIESLLGLSYDKPAVHMREYLEILVPLLRGEQVAFDGERYRVNAGLQLQGPPEVPVLVAALGPVMLQLTARLADGTITWMCGPKTLADYVVPTITEAAKAAGRPPPRVVAGLLVAVTDDVSKTRERVARRTRLYGTMPSYRAMLDREGVEAPVETALLGSEAEVGAAIDRLAETGVTDFIAAVDAEDEAGRQRTLDFLATRL
jgi:F420-dependent oxidoreductase-like protein